MFLSKFRLNYEKNKNSIHSCGSCRTFPGNELSTVNMLDLLSFSDWRNQAFSTTVKANYFGYYGIELITVDIPNITTDLNGNDINSKKLYS